MTDHSQSALRPVTAGFDEPSPGVPSAQATAGDALSATAVPDEALSPKGRRTREALLDAAEVLLARGEDLVSGAVAAEAGVATGTFYRYFEDKDALLAAAFARTLDGIIAAVGQALSPAAVLDRGVAAVLGSVVDDVASGYAAAAPVIAASLARMGGSRAVREVYRDRHVRAVGVLATFLTRLQRAGLADVTDVQATATAAVVLIQGLNHPAVRADPDGAIRDRLRTALAALVTGAPD